MIPKIIHFCWLSGDAYPQKYSIVLNRGKIYSPSMRYVFGICPALISILLHGVKKHLK